MKLRDIEKGSQKAYERAAALLLEQVQFELDTCTMLYGTDPNILTLFLAAALAESVEGEQPCVPMPMQETPSLSS